MASSLFVSFFMPLYAPKSSIQGLSSQEFGWRKVVVFRLLSRSAGTRAMSFAAAGTHGLSISSVVQQSVYRSSTTLLENFGDLVSCFSVSSCTHRRIIGYWVGPDIDDGWGYVEAFIYQIS